MSETIHRSRITEFVRHGKQPTFRAFCLVCGWVSKNHDAEDDAENDSDGHLLAMAGEAGR